MKRILSLVICFVLVCSMSGLVYADADGSCRTMTAGILETEEYDGSAAPTLSELKTLKASGRCTTVSTTGVELVLPTEKQMLTDPFRAVPKANNGHNIYLMPKPESGNGNLGKVSVSTEVWVVADNGYYYFFVTDDGRMGWNGHGFLEKTSVQPSRSSNASKDVLISSYDTPTPGELEIMKENGSCTTVSTTGVELVLPTEKQMLTEPLIGTVRSKRGNYIYIMPKPKAGNGNLGKVDEATEVMILADNGYYYFFITDDGRMGWNGHGFFDVREIS